MRINKFLLIVFSTLLLTGLQSLRLNPRRFGESAVAAQTPDARKAEAYRLFQQGQEQFQTSQFEAALKSWSQALIIYREIKDRKFCITSVLVRYIDNRASKLHLLLLENLPMVYRFQYLAFTTLGLSLALGVSAAESRTRGGHVSAEVPDFEERSTPRRKEKPQK